VRPSILDDYGVDQALARYIEETAKRVDFPIDYQCVFPPDRERLPNETEVTLYRITQEAMTNIIRHAHASQASVVLMCRQNEVSLIIEDNGQGFDLPSIKQRPLPPLGIVGMRERAELVGGDLVVDTQLGKGATIHVRIPVHPEKTGKNTDEELNHGNTRPHSG
jgi:signal transduction histidine kinase